MNTQIVSLTVAHVSRYVGQTAILVALMLYSSPENVGRFTLALAIAAPVFVVASLGMRTLILTNERTHRFRTYLLARLNASGIAAALSLMICIAIAPDQLLLILGVISMKVAESFLDLASAWWHLQSQFTRLLWVSTGSALLTGLAGFWWMPVSAGLGVFAAGTVALVSSILGLLMVLDSGRRPRTRGAFGLREQLQIVRAGFPLGLAYGITTLLVAAPQWSLGVAGDLVGAAQFAILMYLMTGADLILNPLTQHWAFDSAQNRSADGVSAQWVSSQALRFCLRLAPVMLTGLAVGWFVLAALAPAYLPNAWDVAMVGLCMILAPFVHLGATSLAVANRYSGALAAVLPSVVIVVLLSMVLTPRFGLSGAVLAFTCGYLSRAVVPMLMLRARREKRGKLA